MGREGELPGGTVAFLFSDIEGSTRLWELRPEMMATAVARHDELLNGAIVRAGGHVVKWTGDGVLAAFSDANSAMEAAVAAQCLLTAETDGLRSRMGIHAGPATPIEGDYHGPTVNRAARIMGLAHGGQILVSSTVAALTTGSPGVSLRDLGEHALRDIAQPERLHQVLGTGLADAFPPITTASSIPVAASSFIGRDEEIEFVSRLVEENRLVTVTGVGGVGKTRLALEVARSLAGRFDVIGLAELAPLADPGAITRTVASAMKVSLQSDLMSIAVSDVTAALHSHLRNTRALVVLDNCEHLLDGTAELAESLLAACPRTHMLATSRESLEVEGERTYRVPSLATDDATSLFLDRAAAVGSAFAAGDPDLEAIADICTRLDGIPLAIELAASRISHLSPREISDRLDDRFRLLVGGGRRRVQRQQTLLATLDWSYELLEPTEQRLLRQLAVFPGTFDLAAVEGIFGDRLGREAVNVLASLVAKSLVIVDSTVSPTRYRLLETVRIYAQDKLVASGEADSAHGAHGAYYLEWGEALEPWNKLFDNVTLPVLRVEQDNLQTALDWAASTADHDRMAALACVMLMLWWEDSQGDEATYWLDRIDQAALEPWRVADVSAIRSIMSVLVVEPHEQWTFHAARALEAADKESWATSVARIGLAFGHAISGKLDAALAALLDAARVARAVGASCWATLALGLRATNRLLAGDVSGALTDAREAVRLDPANEIAGVTLVIAAHIAGEHDTANDAASRLSALPGRFVAASEAVVLAMNEAGQGELAAARRRLAAAASQANEDAGPSFNLSAPTNLLGYAVVAALEGDATRAGLLLGSIDRPPGWGLSLTTPLLPIYRHYRDVVREKLGPEEARRLRDEGRATPRTELLEQELARWAEI